MHLVETRKAGPATRRAHVAGITFLCEVTLRRPEMVATIPWPRVGHGVLKEILSATDVTQLHDAVESAPPSSRLDHRRVHRPGCLLMSAARMLVATFALYGCGSSSSPSPSTTGMDASTEAGADAASVCPDDLPPSCPRPIPDYQTEVQPILATYCATCHSPTGCCGYDEVTYTEVYYQESSILQFVYNCSMPPITSPQLTLQERVTLINWLVCVGTGEVGPDGGLVTADAGK
jgi:hypothetical protein